MSQIRSVRVQVYGIVQGVGFRYFTHQEASKLGLRGRATNYLMAQSRYWLRVMPMPLKN